MDIQVKKKNSPDVPSFLLAILLWHLSKQTLDESTGIKRNRPLAKVSAMCFG
jgi:hypothetical protein